jgi:hypothetical protein
MYAVKSKNQPYLVRTILMTAIDKIAGEIEADLMIDIINRLPNLEAIYSADHSVLIHGMGGQPRKFYRELKSNKSIELLWTGWSSNFWWTYLLSFIPGQSGLCKILDRHKAGNLFIEIGDQSTCGLYFIPNNKLEELLLKVKKDRMWNNILSLIENENNYFLLTVYFDYHGGNRDGDVFYREVIMGENLDDQIKWNLMRSE